MANPTTFMAMKSTESEEKDFPITFFQKFKNHINQPHVLIINSILGIVLFTGAVCVAFGIPLESFIKSLF